MAELPTGNVMNLLMKITKKGETRDNGIAGNDIR